MKGRIVGILLSGAGIACLLWAFITINSSDSAAHLSELFIGGILGAAAFFVGIRLMPSQATGRKEIWEERPPANMRNKNAKAENAD